MICLDCLWRSEEQEASDFKSFCCVEAVARIIEILGIVPSPYKERMKFPTGNPVGAPGSILYSTVPKD